MRVFDWRRQAGGLYAIAPKKQAGVRIVVSFEESVCPGMTVVALEPTCFNDVLLVALNTA